MVQERQLLKLLYELIAMLPDTYRQVVELGLQERLPAKQAASKSLTPT